MPSHRCRFMLCVAALLLVAERAPGQARPMVLPGRVVDVKAGEFFFLAPDTIPAGLTTFRLLQTGMMATRLKEGVTGRALVADQGDNTRGFHMLWVVRLDSGKTVADLHRAAQAGERETPWAPQLGGAASILPPLTTNVTIDLPPGNYALVCYVGSARADRSRYHLLHGMARPLTVVSAAGARARPPRVDVVAKITGDGIVTFSRPIREGRTVVRVENLTDRNWEFKFQRIPDGMTGVEYLAQTGEAEPGVSIGGLSSVPPGQSLITTLEFTRGEFAVGTHASMRHATSRAFVVNAGRR